MNFSLLNLAAILATASAFTPAKPVAKTTPTALRMSSSTWYEDDKVVTLVPKFKIKEGMKEQYIALLPKFVELVKANEEGSCVHYGFVSVRMMKFKYIFVFDPWIIGASIFYWSRLPSQSHTFPPS